MSKTYFDKFKPKPALVQTDTCKVNGAKHNSYGPLQITKCLLNFLKKVQQQFIVCKHLL